MFGPTSEFWILLGILVVLVLMLGFSLLAAYVSYDHNSPLQD